MRKTALKTRLASLLKREALTFGQESEVRELLTRLVHAADPDASALCRKARRQLRALAVRRQRSVRDTYEALSARLARGEVLSAEETEQLRTSAELLQQEH